MTNEELIEFAYDVLYKFAPEECPYCQCNIGPDKFIEVEDVIEYLKKAGYWKDQNIKSQPLVQVVTANGARDKGYYMHK